jgi:heterodisulfide reductase subunit B1
MKKIPDKNILLFKSCLVSTEYPGVESSNTYLFDKLGVEYIKDQRQSCCTGLGHYYDLFDQLSTTVLAARNFYIARETNHPNIAVMCATCYAILKKSAEILNQNDEAREKINGLLVDAGMEKMVYHKGDIDPHKNIFHAVEILFNKKKEIESENKLDFSQFNIATHHACHYCKVHYEDTIGGVRNPMLLDELATTCGVSTVDWYDQKRLTCGAGFRQRFTNNELSLKVTAEKLMSLKDNQVDILLHMCPNCQMQFDRYQPVIENKLGETFNMFHLNISQFLALAMGADPYSTVGVQTHTVPVEPLLQRMGILQNASEGTHLKIKD